MCAQDKPPRFVNSSEWIGAIELSMVLSHLLKVSTASRHAAPRALGSQRFRACQVTAKTLFVTRGDEIPNHARQLAQHFQTQARRGAAPGLSTPALMARRRRGRARQ